MSKNRHTINPIQRSQLDSGANARAERQSRRRLSQCLHVNEWRMEKLTVARQFRSLLHTTGPSTTSCTWSRHNTSATSQYVTFTQLQTRTHRYMPRSNALCRYTDENNERSKPYHCYFEQLFYFLGKTAIHTLSMFHRFFSVTTKQNTVGCTEVNIYDYRLRYKQFTFPVWSQFKPPRTNSTPTDTSQNEVSFFIRPTNMQFH